jgi:tetratricopeptide (TPR) repeat protein
VPGAPLFDQWVVAERAACRAAVLGTLDRAVQLARERGDTATGIQVGRRLVALEPLHEEAHRALMWFLAHGGQPSAALAQYERCRSVLAEELGVEPSPATLALREEIARVEGFAELSEAQPGAMVRAPGTGSLPIPRELPRPPADFTGRGSELATLLGLLAVGGPGDTDTATTRLDRPVVISAIDGMGGIGKSALAIQAANQLADHFPDGQLYVNLRAAAVGHPDRRRAAGRPPRLARAGAGRAAGRCHPPPGRTGRRRVGGACQFPGLPAHPAGKLRPGWPGRCGRAAAARLLDQPESTTEIQLERLVDAQLLESRQPDRYQFHDLLRLYARQHASSQQPEPERRAALTRLLEFYTATAWQTQALLRPGDRRAAATHPRWRDGGRQFPDMVAALAWLEAERANLLAAIGQATAGTPKMPAALVGQLTRALFGFFLVRGYWQDGAWANQTALEVARRAQDQAAQAHALIDLGALYRRLGRYHQALACSQDGFAIFRELGDRDSQAASLTNLGAAHRWLGQHDNAIACLRESLAIYQEVGDRHGQAHSLSNLGLAYERLGQHDEAVACLQESLAIRRELGARHGQAHSLTSLGEVYRRLGRYRQAVACLQEGLAIYRELGDRHGQAISLSNLGAVNERLGEHDEAVARLQEGLAIYRELGGPYGQAAALRHLGETLRAVARHQQARAAWQEALAICQALQLPEADQIHAQLAALPSQDPEPANGP